jgi:hypothetical protein
MTLLPPAVTDRVGVDIAGAAATSTTGDTFANSGSELLFVKNGAGAPITLTLDIQSKLDGQALTDPAPSLTNGHTYVLGPFPPAYYNDANGRVKVTCSDATSITLKVIKPATT